MCSPRPRPPVKPHPLPIACVSAGLLMTTKIVLSAPLPRVYEETGNGRVAAMAAVAGQPSTLIGGDFKVEELTRISKETVRADANACSTFNCALSSFLLVWKNP